MYWLVWTRTLHWEQLMSRLVPSSSRWGVTGCSSHSESSSVVVVKHISGIRGLVRIRPPATRTGPSMLFALSVWQQPQHTKTWSSVISYSEMFFPQTETSVLNWLVFFYMTPAALYSAWSICWYTWLVITSEWSVFRCRSPAGMYGTAYR